MRIIKNMFWISAGIFLLGYQLFLLGVVSWDVYCYTALNLRLYDALELALAHPRIDLNLFHLVSVILLSPLVIAFFKYQISDVFNFWSTETPLWLRNASLYSYFLLFIPLGGLWFIAPSMEQLSGNAMFGAEKQIVFTSLLSGYLVYFNAGFLVCFVVGLTQPLFLDVTKEKGKMKEFWTDFNSWVTFSYPKSEYYPLYGRRKLNFNAGGVSPEIKAISRKIKTKTLKYQKTIPSSLESKKYLQSLYWDCKTKILEMLKFAKDELNIEFYAGTSRAIEVAISRMPKSLVIILSPHEHFSEAEVSNWLALQHEKHDEIKVEQMIFQANDHERKWDDQVGLMQSKLKEIVKRYNAGDAKWNAENEKKILHNFLFIFSEVSSVTGIIIKPEQVIPELLEIQEVKDLRNADRFTFFIDASHSVGNYKDAFNAGQFELEKNDLYIFSAHKWILSPEPLGVVIGLKTCGLFDSKSYDGWGKEGLPKTTVNATSAASLLGCLEFQLEEDNMAEFIRNSSILKDRFLKLSDEGQSENYQSKFEVISIVNKDIMSNMITIKPKEGYKWDHTVDSLGQPNNTKEGLLEYLANKGIIVEVLDNRDFSLWVRLTFLYFATLPNVKSLRDKLNDSIVSP